MPENVNHIISRLSWQTSFDQKEKGPELQSRLSNWSRNLMEKEITAVLDRLCPPKEVWKIQRLELDLGVIDYNEFEPACAVKLRKQLYEKLQDLIFRAKNYNSNEIEIQSEAISRMDLLYEFLLNGVMPWNYQATVGSVNELLEHELRHNLRNVVAMLLELGITRENVRRRIAWQVSEANIITIIEALEPGSSDQIIEFSNTVAHIQAKQTIVQASAGGFKKNLWFWVLNYLMKNHGSQFNKKEFLKSSISQMADHYNTAYDDLFTMIEKAVAKTLLLKDGHTDFILTLKVLSNERQVATLHSPFNVNNIEEDQWHRLKNYFLNKEGSHRPAGAHKEFNQLLSQLAKKDKKAFYALINSLNNQGFKWQSLADQLDEVSLGAIAKVLHPEEWEILTGQIDFLEMLCRETGIEFEKNKLWQTGAGYLFSHRGTAYSGRAFMYYCANKLQSANDKFHTNILEYLISNRVPAVIKTGSMAEMYREFATVIVSRVSIPEIVYYKERMRNLVHALSDQLVAGASTVEKFMEWQRQLARIMRMLPKAALQTLLEFSERDRVQKLLPLLLDEDTATLLLRHAKNEQPAMISYISRVIKELKADTGTAALASMIDRRFFSAGLHVMISKPGLNPSAFLELLLEHLYTTVPVSMMGQFSLLVHKLFSGNKLLSYGIAARAAEKIRAAYSYSKETFFLNGVVQLIKTSPPDQAWTADVLAAHFGNNEFIQLRHHNKAEGDGIINYFLTGGATYKQNITERYTQLLYRQLKTVAEIEIRYRVAELFWKCILDYRNYRGDHKRFIALLRKALTISSGLPFIQQQDINAGKKLPGINAAEGAIPMVKKDAGFSAREENILHGNTMMTPPGDAGKLPARELLQTARLGMLSDLCSNLLSTMKVPAWYYEGTMVPDVKNLVNEIVHHYPPEFLTVLKSGPLTMQQMYWLSTMIDFNVLTASVSKLNPNRKVDMDTLLAFYELMGKISSGQIQEILFKKLLYAWATGNWKIIMAENILHEICQSLVTRSGISQKDFVAALNKQCAYLPRPLQLALGQLKNKDREPLAKEQTAIANKPVPKPLKKQNRLSVSRHGIEVKNAGLVMISSYILLLFERLGITANKKFIDYAAQLDAVHYLQYMVTGLSNTGEAFLPLNKLLCGLPMEEPVPPGIEISGSHIKMIDGLIKAVIGYWPSIGNTSVDGFRGNWLVRNGLLSEQEDRWELTVEKRAYDVLISTSPFSFSIIKYPWMNKPLHVNWPY